MQQRIKAHWIFFKSTLPIGIGAALGICFIGTGFPLYTGNMQGASLIMSFTTLFLFYLPGGIILDLLYKEIANKELYYFYNNLAITRIELWIVTLLFSYIPCVLIRIINHLWIKA